MKENKKRQFQFNSRAIKQLGFSLPEITIVVFVIAILLVLALPQSLRQMQLYRLQSSASSISNKLMEARMNAIKRNRIVWLRLDKALNNAQIKTSDGTSTIDVNFPEKLPDKITLDASDSIEIFFDSMGRLNTGTQTFTIKDTLSGKRKNITVSPSGKITVGQIY